MGQIYKGNQLIIDSGGGGSTIVVDSALSTTSENPVQNKVITEALNEGLVLHSATEPATPEDGMLWYDETNKVLKIYSEDDAEWKELGEGGVTSINGNTGDITMSTGKITLTQNGGNPQHFFLDQTIDKTIDLKGVDKSWKNKTISNGELELGIRTICYPSADFTLIKPAELVDGEEYVVRFINGSTPFNMTLGHGFTNPFGVDLSLSADAKDQFTFMAIEGILELQPAPVLVAPTENPQAPTGLEATVSGTTGSIKWIDPLDAGTNIWLNTKLVRKAGSEPTSLSDGTVVVTVTTRNQYQSTGYDDSGLTAGTTYYYRAFAEFDEGEILGSAAVDITPIVEYGIWHNATLGLITVSDGAGNAVTIADKNLGATSTNTTSTNSYGNQYQRGNNYAFPKSSDFVSSSISYDRNSISVSGYGPNNYYSSNIYRPISTPYTTLNTDLRGETTDTNIARRGPCAEGYHIPSYTEFSTLINSGISMGAFTNNDWSGYVNYLKIPLSGFSYMLTSSGSNKYSSGIGTCFLLHTSDCHIYEGSQQREWIFGGESSPVFTERNINTICPIRPFKNEVAVPDNTWTKLYPAQPGPTPPTPGAYTYDQIIADAYATNGWGHIMSAELNTAPDVYFASLQASGNLVQQGSVYYITHDPTSITGNDIISGYEIFYNPSLQQWIMQMRDMTYDQIVHQATVQGTFNGLLPLLKTNASTYYTNLTNSGHMVEVQNPGSKFYMCADGTSATITEIGGEKIYYTPELGDWEIEANYGNWTYDQIIAKATADGNFYWCMMEMNRQPNGYLIDLNNAGHIYQVGDNYWLSADGTSAYNLNGTVLRYQGTFDEWSIGSA